MRKPAAAAASNPYFQYINATPPEMIPSRTYELCLQATVTTECVTGVAGCILAWKSHHDPTLVIRAMADAYVQRNVSARTKLAIIYIFNDIVQRDPTTYAASGYRFFLEVIAPLGNVLPPDIQNAHCRTLEILKTRQIYSKEQISSLKRSFSMNRAQQKQILASTLARSCNNTGGDSLFGGCPAALKGKIDSTIKATQVLCQDPKTADSCAAWAKSLLTAAGLTACSAPETFNNLDNESRTAIQAAVARALDFIGLEMELIQYLILDWSICLEENKNRILYLINQLGNDFILNDSNEKKVSDNFEHPLSRTSLG